MINTEYYGKTPFHYERQANIPIKSRCNICNGFGIYRFQHSDFGPEQKDWKDCWKCEGTGEKPIIEF